MSSAATTQPQQHTGLEALYVLNKAAKRFARRAAEGNESLNLVTADCPRALRERKRALYRVKRRVLETIYEDATRIELHAIRGTEYYCFYFGSWSFHVPAERFDAPVDVDGHLVLPDFDASHTATRAQLSLDEALRRVREEYGINANEQLDQRHLVATDGEFVDIGWPSMDA